MNAAGASGRLTLVGTEHRADRAAKLERLLADLRPDHLTLEMSPYAVAFRRRRGPLLLQRLETLLDRLAAEGGRSREELAAHPEAAGIRRLLALPFEYRATARHAAERGIPFELLDSSLISARKLRRVERELVCEENLRTLLALPPVATAPAESARLAGILLAAGADPALRQAFLARRRGPEGIGERDRRLAAALRRRRAAERHLVHIGGWVHLVDDPQGETLFSRLRDLGPARILLDS